MLFQIDEVIAENAPLNLLCLLMIALILVSVALNKAQTRTDGQSPHKKLLKTS